MYKIAICDDSDLQIDLLNDYLEVFKKQHPGLIDVASFSSPYKLLECNDKTDIFILDMLMPEMTGMELAQQLRNRGDNGKILFLTSTGDYVFDAFSVKASDYLLKPVTPEKLYEKLRFLCEELDSEEPKTINIKTVSGTQIIKIKDINFIENIERAPNYYLTSGEIVTGVSSRLKFAQIIEPFILDYGFVRCSVSCAVNSANISGFDSESNAISFLSGDNAYCSRNYLSDIKKIINTFKNR